MKEGRDVGVWWVWRGGQGRREEGGGWRYVSWRGVAWRGVARVGVCVCSWPVCVCLFLPWPPRRGRTDGGSRFTRETLVQNSKTQMPLRGRARAGLIATSQG